MNLTEVLSFLELESNLDSCLVKDIQIDSRLVTTGDLFIAIPGLKTDGRDYVEQAILQGAVAVLTEAPYSIDKQSIPIITVANLKHRLPALAAFFYNHPAQDLKIIGITGTNGKTSCSHYTAQLLSANDLLCAVMGTLGNGLLNNLEPSNLTTGDCCSIQRNFAAFRAQGAKFVAMEASSHALTQNRLEGINFDTAVFTNLSQDHLDYHSDMQEYFVAKARLFSDFAPRNCVINIDDAYGRKLLDMIPKESKVIIYSITDNTADIYMQSNTIHTPWGTGVLDSPLIGKFNLSNLLACIACCGLYGLRLEDILDKVRNIIPVPGRMQKVAIKTDNLPMVIVDYAHTPDALVNVLQTLAEYKPRTLYCVFGCGGDRDRAKRPLMLQAALQHSDQVIITMDNPRTEEPQQIVNDILAGHKLEANMSIEFDRAKAIVQTIKLASSQDIILIAGKGHEDYQIIGTEKRPFSDLLVAQQALA